MACNVFKVEYIITDFKTGFYTESKNCTLIFHSDQIFKIQALT